MSKKDILEYFYTNSTELSAQKILIILAFGLIISAIIFITYKITYAGVSYSIKFNSSNVVILLITVVIMLMISSNIVISLGMVGALSIIRFRTAIKDPRDTVYIFWSLVEGLCIGSQNFKLSIISTLVIAIVLLGFSFFTRRQDKYLVIIRGTGIMENDKILEIIRASAKSVRLKASNNSETASEAIFEAVMKGGVKSELISEIQSQKNVFSVNYLLETGEIVG